MTVLLQYHEVVLDNTMEVKRVVFDGAYLTITSRGGDRVVVTPEGDTLMHVADLGQEHRIVGEVRFD